MTHLYIWVLFKFICLIFLSRIIILNYFEAIYREIELVKFLLSNKNVNVNLTNKEGETLLHLGTFKINIPYFHVKIIILKFFEACYNGKIDLVKFLLSNMSVDVNCTNIKGDTPLHLGKF